MSLCIYYSIELRKELKKLYYFCLRKLLNINFHHNNPNNDRLNTLEINNLLRNNNLFAFEYRVFFRLSLFIHKINVNKFPIGLFSQINLNSIVKSNYNLRNKNNYFIPYVKITSKNNYKNFDSSFSIFFCKFINILFLEQFNFPLILFKKHLLLNIDSLYRKFNSDFKFFSLYLDF